MTGTFYRPIDASRVPTASRSAAETMRRHVREDLKLARLRLSWFAAGVQPLEAQEWCNPVIECLNTDLDGCVALEGRVCRATPSVVWCRADLSPVKAALTVAHEARHLWQQTDPGWVAPEGNFADAEAARSAIEQWKQRREADAVAYSDGLIALAQEIGRSASLIWQVTREPK
jgi:hypothetical protein